MTKLFPLLALVIAAPAAAQTASQQHAQAAAHFAALAEFKPYGPVGSHDKPALEVANRARALMEAEGGRGLKLMQALESGKVLFDIETPQDMTRLCELGRREVWPGEFQPIVRCDPALAKVSPRYAALLLAEEAAKWVWRDMPPCAEKDFIIDSLMTRAWLEVGGERAKLPSFDGRKDEARAARIERWFKVKLRDAVLDAEARGKSTLATALAAYPKRAKELQDLAKAFAVEEDEWAKANWRRLSDKAPR